MSGTQRVLPTSLDAAQAICRPFKPCFPDLSFLFTPVAAPLPRFLALTIDPPSEFAMEEADTARAAGVRVAPAKRGHTDVMSKESDCGIVGKASTSRWRVGGCGSVDVPCEGHGGNKWHVRRRVLQSARPPWLRPSQQLSKDVDWLINSQQVRPHSYN
jgi:hypothetical protein